ncbi:MAG TPA: Trk system potassium transporter TrkA [Thermoanaerobacterales bacterium]|nr:Trk system potassium transporter TrkA [Thermoanaerobacterales bacterium]
MRIVIIGSGKVGYQIATSLSREKHDIVVVDTDQEVLNRLNENIDVLTIRGNGISTKVLEEAGVKNSDLFIAVTNSDEVNMVACITAKQMADIKAIARIRDPEYANELNFIKEKFGIDYIINPEKATAKAIIGHIMNTYSGSVEDFAKGRVRMIEVPVKNGIFMAGKQIKDLIMPKNMLIGAISRDGKIIIPNGEDYILEADTLYIIGMKDSIAEFCNMINMPQLGKVRKVMIVGGGRIGYYLTKFLVDIGISVKLIEQDIDRCKELSDILGDGALILNGDGTNIELLEMEKVNEVDVFISVTGYDEENLLVSLLAKRLGAKKVIAKVSRPNYTSIIETIGVDVAVSPRLITASDILRYIRGERILSVSLLMEGEAEVLELIVGKKSVSVNKTLRDIKFPHGVLVSSIVRQGSVIIPDGNTQLRGGDRVIIFSLQPSIEKTRALFAEPIGGSKDEPYVDSKGFGRSINM